MLISGRTQLHRLCAAAMQPRRKKVLKVLKFESDEARCPQTPGTSLKDNN